jgi:uncharacterized protein YjdB
MRTSKCTGARSIVLLLAVGASACSGELLSPATPTAISFSPEALTLRVGANQQVIPSALFNNQPISVSQLQFRWSSSAQQVATVDNTGRITAIARGSTQILAQLSQIPLGSIVNSPLSVTVVGVSSVAIAPSTVVLEVGRTAALVANVQVDVGVTPLPVAWASNDLSKVTVSATGQITALSPGTALITATCEGRSATALITIVPASVAYISLTPASSTVEVGASVVITATPRDGSGSALIGRVISWQSSNPAIATVSASGTVTGVTPGSTVIVATSEGKSASAPITVTPVSVASISITPASSNVAARASVLLTATPRDAIGNVLFGRAISWQSSNAAIATISASGTVTGVTPGSVLITATSEGKAASAQITVVPTSVASITLTPSFVSVALGSTVVMTATPRDASGSVLTGLTVQWLSSNSAIATISALGLVTGVAPGSTFVQATISGFTVSTSITVTSTTCGAATPYAYGTTVFSMLGASECSYTGTLAQPGVWRLSLTTSAFAPALYFAPVTGSGFGWVWDGPGAVSYELLTGAGPLSMSIGRKANTNGSGAFSFSSATVVGDTASCGSNVAATLGASAQRQLNARDCSDGTNRYRDVYTVYLSAGSVITVTMRSTAFDALLELWAAGATVRSAFNDDGGGGTDSRLTFTAPTSGFYLIRCTTFDAGAVGLYYLTIN